MPYKRRSFGKKYSKYGKSKKYSKGAAKKRKIGSSMRSKSRVTKGYTRAVSGLPFSPLGVEMKYKDNVFGNGLTTFVPNTLNAAGTPIIEFYGNPRALASTLCVIPQGTGPSQRIGRKVTVKSIEGGITVFMGKSNSLVGITPAVASQVFRIWIVLDRQANGVAIDPYTYATSIWKECGQNYGMAGVQMRELTQESRFTVLKTLEFDLCAKSTFSTTENVPRSITKRFKLKCNIPLEYTSTTGVATEQVANRIVMLTAGGLAAVVPALDSSSAIDLINLHGGVGVVRLRYTDL